MNPDTATVVVIIALFFGLPRSHWPATLLTIISTLLYFGFVLVELMSLHADKAVVLLDTGKVYGLLVVVTWLIWITNHIARIGKA